MGGRVRKEILPGLAGLPRVALVVPAGISTLYVVACGKRTSGSNTIVRVPIQRHAPLGCGESFTGVVAAASPCEVTATLGWLNVTASSGASGTPPSGLYRSTRRPPPGAPPGRGRP